jgi:hypothetical protein
MQQEITSGSIPYYRSADTKILPLVGLPPGTDFTISKPPAPLRELTHAIEPGRGIQEGRRGPTADPDCQLPGPDAEKI